jgi:hypothetical protein
MHSQKVPPEIVDYVTSNTTIVPAQEAFLVDAPTLRHLPRRWIEVKRLSG